MSQDSIADRGTEEKAISERVTRGVELYAERCGEIEVKGSGVYMVPASTHQGRYRVVIQDHVSCTCADRRGHAMGLCKHIVAALIVDAKLPTYRVQKCRQGDVYELLESRAGVESVIAWGPLDVVYHEKWSLEGLDMEISA